MGLDEQRMVEVISATGGRSFMFGKHMPNVLKDDFTPGFMLSLSAKDIRLALAAADQLRVPLPLADLVHNRFLTLLAHGGEGLDWSAIGALAAKDAAAAIG